MPTSNPQQPNCTESPSENATLSRRSGLNAAVLAELGVKLVGLMFLLDGVGGLISQVTTLFLERREMLKAGMEPYMNAISLGGIVSSFFFLFAGVYLVTNGKAAIELILMTDDEPADEDVQS